MPRLPYVTLDVFTSTPLSAGNPLAIVSIPPSVTLTKLQEHQITKEFNYSETVFIYPPSPSISAHLTKIAIWTPTQELPFAGHPTVGTGWYLSTLADTDARYAADEFKLLAPAGILSISKGEGGKTRVDTPHKVTVWESTIPTSRIAEVVNLPLSFYEHDHNKIFAKGVTGSGVPAVSIVDGLTFALIEVGSPSVLRGLKAGSKGVVLDIVKDVGGTVGAGGRSFIGCYCYFVVGSGVEGATGKVEVRTRMFFDGDMEDPATGSAACALASYLAITRGGDERGVDEWVVEVTQGVEMGRKSDIGVTVLLEKAVEGEGRKVSKVLLEGEAVKVMEGVLTI
ncbi:hypothetical protein TWF694_011734 [Orbilia ellipsospora]|uniref:Diaminopimelate epimerase-like protein n=1 Tax=Orbilia ellipsospora TaxID=2528407 RepID=A0AAV9X7B5_9PEZI